MIPTTCFVNKKFICFRCEAVSASDYVEFSNYMIEDNRYGRYCGQMKEFHVESDRNFFKVTFRSNDRLDGTGFKAIYQFLEATDKYQSPPMQDSSNSLCELQFLLPTSYLKVYEMKYLQQRVLVSYLLPLL